MLHHFDGIADYRTGDGDLHDVVNHDRAVAKAILDSNGITLPSYGVELDGEVVAELFRVESLGLKTFYFPDDVKNFKNITAVTFYGNELTELPKGIEKRNWGAVYLNENEICNPSQETIAYLDEMVGSYKGGGDWRETQVCPIP